MDKKGCGRQYCSHCGDELIHRDHRKWYESSSALGQIIYREGPRLLTVSDIDTVTLKILNRGKSSEKKLLRIIEQKQPNHKFDGPQRDILFLLNQIIVHILSCTDASHIGLDSLSGVFILRGLIESANNQKNGNNKKTIFGGPQTMERLSDGYMKTINNHEEFFSILDPESKARRNGGKNW